ncbi:MAG: S1C family serine protease [Bdellovibrionales bacterium]
MAACGTYVKKVDYDLTREVPEDAAPAPILFRGAEFLIPPGQDIGFESHNARFCGWPRLPLSRTELRRKLDTKYLKQSFNDTLQAAGYDMVDSIDLIPEESEDDILRAEYTVSAKIKGAQVDLCQNDIDNAFIFFTTRSGVDGEVYLSVDWSVYDPVRRSVVYKTTTEGYTKRLSPNNEGFTLMLHDAFDMAAHNLGADEQFYDLIVNGIKPVDWQPRTLRKEYQDFESRHQFDPTQTVTIHQNGLSHTPFTQDIDHKRKHAVMIQKIGHGSGFFITKDGHILTNAHVVGDAIRMRVVTADKAQKLTAEVLRVDKARDVALLKLEEVPDTLDIITLPIRTQIPSVGEDVYALGTPKHYATLQDTLTHGIVSAYREDFKHFGLRQNYIQSDVEIHGGNSGGPLYDKNGNVIGIAVIGLYANESKIGNALNLFIPIGEALDALDIDLQ